MIIKNKYQLKRHVHYNQYTGVFTRIQQPTMGAQCIGEIKIPPLANGGRIQILKCYYQASHLAYLYMTGKFPDGKIRHIDGDLTNFKWENLRLDEKTFEGIGSVTWIEKNKRYQAYIGKKYIGLFKTSEEATSALNAAHLSLRSLP